MSTIRERTIAVIARVLKLDSEEAAMLHQDVGYKKLKKWTSAKHAEIIVALEDEFGIEVDGRDMLQLNDVPKIVDYLSRTQ
jgi:acyl carrier protein